MDQDGVLISAKWLMTLFENKKDIQLLFLNACYSADQISELKNSKKIKYIIGNEGEISEYSATEFASIFYKHTKEQKTFHRHMLMQVDEYKTIHFPEVKTKQVFNPTEDPTN